jgi:hypothetical protein
MQPWESILEVARFCPSPHNTQPWKLRPLSATDAALYIERRRMLPDEDLTGAFILLAMGMFVESVKIVAANQGLLVTLEKADSVRVGRGAAAMEAYGRLRVVGESGTDPVSNELFLKRRTSRLHPLPTPVSDDALRDLEWVAASGGQRLVHTSDAGLVGRILEKNVEAVFHDLNEPAYHDEIESWFRYGDGHAERTNDGLSSTCMNMSALELYFTGKAPGLMKNPLSRPLIRALYHWRLGTAAHLGMLSGPFWDPGQSADAGVCLLRLWLEMERRGLSIHPFGNLVTNKEAHAWLTRAVGVEGIWLVFRLSHTAPPPASRRLAVKELMLDS